MWCLGWVVEALVFVRCAFGCRPILLEMLRSMSYKLQVESKHWTELRNLLLQSSSLYSNKVLRKNWLRAAAL